ncbi:SLATT domain-containing protein [Lactobacillus helveticus]|uniref:SLATT domain-containing protein n=1 Tax=Lactobacillus helveticus TaxID=1587 RepID=UPI0038551542
MDKESLFNDVKDLLLSVKWTHKITAVHYDRLSKYNCWLVWSKVIAAFISSGSVASLLVSANIWTKSFSIFGSIIFTAIELVSNKFRLEENQVNLFNAKEELWEISQELTSLDREIKSSSDNAIPIQVERKRYIELLNRVKAIQIRLSPSSSKDIKVASRDIKKRHDYDNWENQRILLPPDLWHFREDK